MLQIRLRRDPSTESGGGARPLPAETVTVACPDHLVLADLPVAKGIGSVTAASVVKNVGRRSRRQLGERVHFCVRCDFPIAVYGRLSPCAHAFCLECARSDSICYLCDERVQKIQTIKLMEGIFICAAPHCLKSFLKRNDFEAHIHNSHTDLLQPGTEKEDFKDLDVQSTKQSSASESTLRAPSRPGFSPGSNVQPSDFEEKYGWQNPREPILSRSTSQPKGPPPMLGHGQNYPADSQADVGRPPGFDRTGSLNFDMQGTPQRESSQFSDKQQGSLSGTQFPEYPCMQPMQAPNFVMPMNPNLPPPYVLPTPYAADGTPAFYGAPYGMAGPGSMPEPGSEQGSLLGFPPGPNFPAAYPQNWNPGHSGMPFDASQGGKVMDRRDCKGILASQPLQTPQPPLPLPHHFSQQLKPDQFFPGDMGRDGQGFRWQHDSRDGYRGNQE